MKKLMFTLIVAALSGSSLFGIIAPGLAQSFRAQEDPAMTRCIEGKVSQNATDEEAYQASQECLQELYGSPPFQPEDTVRYYQ